MISNKILYIYNIVKNGKLTINNDFIINKFISKFKDDTELEFIIREIKDSRSLKLNRTYWMYLTILEEHLGVNKEDLHNLFKDKYLIYITRILHQDVLSHKSTSTLNNKEFCDYLEKIKIFSSTELNVILPDPE
jgi:hypothetical protein